MLQSEGKWLPGVGRASFSNVSVHSLAQSASALRTPEILCARSSCSSWLFYTLVDLRTMPPQQIASYDESTFHAQEEHIVRKAELDDSSYKASSLPSEEGL